MILIQTNLKTKLHYIVHDSHIVTYDRILDYILTEKSYFGPIYVNTDASNL